MICTFNFQIVGKNKKNKKLIELILHLILLLQQLVPLLILPMERVQELCSGMAKCSIHVSILYPIQIAITAIKMTIIHKGTTTNNLQSRKLPIGPKRLIAQFALPATSRKNKSTILPMV